MCNGCMLSRAAFGFQSRFTGTFSIIYSHKTDAAEREDRELRERALFYVAATRARQELVVTSHGRQSPFMMRLQKVSFADAVDS